MPDLPTTYKKAIGFYPERTAQRRSFWASFWHDGPTFFFTKLFTRPGNFQTIVKQVKLYGNHYKNIDDDGLAEKTRLLRCTMGRNGVTFERVAQSFALIREQADRCLGMRHHDVQLIGGWVMFCGMVAEMETGEGKTLTATLPACTAAFAGMPVHVITVNEYLAGRDAALLAPLYQALGLTVGVIYNNMDPEARKQAYGCDIVYCTNKEIVFDYLRDHLSLQSRPGLISYPLQRLYGQAEKFAKLNLRGLHFAIVDEADSVFVDEARTPLIISGSGDNSQEQKVCQKALALAGQLAPPKEYTLSMPQRQIEISEAGSLRLEELTHDAGGFWASKRQREELVRQALSALHLFQRDKDYIVEGGRIVIVDEYTGRTMEDRSWENGLHQMLECKENCEVTPRKETLARMSYQSFFRRYYHLAGMTGTAREVDRELWSVYDLQVIRVETNAPLIRKALPPRFFQRQTEKMEALLSWVKDLHHQGRPVLIGTRTVEASEKLSALFSQAALPHRVLNARQDKEEAEIIARAGQKGQITIATNMAGRGTDIKLGPGVRELGGLQVIATERHSAGRIDRQLFGRCGRQGDPGSYAEFLSFEDDLIKDRLFSRFGSVSALSKRKPASLRSLWFRLLFSLAQRSSERKHFLIRCRLLKIDEEQERTLAFSGKGE